MEKTDWDQYAAKYRQIERQTSVPSLLVAEMTDRSGTAVDVGCGEGDLMDRLAQQFPTWDVSGFEVSSFRAEVARSRGHRVEVDAGGEIPAGEYDLAISAHVIEHVPDDVDHMRRLAALLPQGGHAYVETPLKLRGGWYFRRSATAGWVLDPTHLREYRSIEALTAVVESAGMSVVAVEVTPLTFPLSAGIALVRRVLHLRADTQDKTTRKANWSVPIPRYRVASLIAKKD